MKRLLAIALCLALPATASAQLFEDFESGTFPPTGWTTTDFTTLGVQVWQTSSLTTQGNFMGTVGETAAYDADNYDVLYNLDEHNSVLTTAAFAATSGVSLRFKLNFQDFAGYGDFNVEASPDGVTFTGIANWTVDTPTGGSSTPQFIIGEAIVPDGTTHLQFRFSDTGTLWWFVQIDDLEWFPTPLQPDDCGYGVSGLVLSEDFESGTFPPTGWTVIDNLTANSTVWDTLANYSASNLTGGTGEAACVDSDDAGSLLNQDTELWTPSFTVPVGASLLFDNDWNTWSAGIEVGDVDISTDGGVTWTLIRQFANNVDERTSFVDVDLSAYAGMTAIVRFHYYFGDYDYWWQLDNIGVGFYDPAPLASTAFRNDVGGTNLSILTDTGAPVMGYPYALEVDVAASGLGYAQIFGYAGTLSLNLGGTSRIVLTDLTDPGGEILAALVLAGPTATYNYVIPNDCALVGFAMSAQAAAFNIPNNAPWVLSNARDIVLGF